MIRVGCCKVQGNNRLKLQGSSLISYKEFRFLFRP